MEEDELESIDPTAFPILVETVSRNEVDIELKVQEINDKLSEYTVRTSTNTSGINEAKDYAYNAHTAVHETEIKSLSYTDERIEELRALFIQLLNQWAANLRGQINVDTGGAINDALVQAGSSWAASLAEMEQAVADAITTAEELRGWASDTINITIPELRAELDRWIQDSETTASEFQEETNIARQEAAAAASRWREMSDNIQVALDHILEADYNNYEAREDILRRVSTDFEGRFSDYDERITSAAGDAGAVVDKVEQLTVEYENQKALIQNVERALIDGDEQLSQQITALSVGAQTQFDSAKIWHFDTNNDGWTGTWVDGYLRVLNTTIVRLLNINATRYRQIKFRIKKVGTPTWNGSLNWEGAEPVGPIVLDEPTWSGDYAEITINPEWSGTLTGILLTLSSGSDVDNHYRLDWITVGRPSPGASTADLASERSARIAQDAATAVRIDALSSELNTLDGLQTGTADAIDGVRTSVEVLDGRVTSLIEDLTLLESTVTDLNTGMVGNASAIDLLQSRVLNTEDGLTAVNNRITDLNSTIGDATSTALDLLTTRVEQNVDETVILSQKITSLESNLDGKASATALSGLNTRVTDAEGEITSISNSITVLTSNIAGKASASALNNLTTRVTSAEGKITTMSQDITVLKSTVPNLATATAVSALTTRVSSTEQSLITQASQITNLTASIGTRASVSAMDALTVRVENVNGRVTTEANKIIALQATQGRMSANGLLRITTNTSVAGAQARIALHAEATASGTTHTAGLYLDAKSNGTSNVIIIADRFAIVSNPGSGEQVAPFVIDNGKVYLNTTVVIRNADIGTAKIGGNAITVPAQAEANNTINLTTGWTNILTVAMNREGARTNILCSATIAGYSMAIVKFRLLRNGAEIGSFFGLTGTRGTQSTVSFPICDNNLATGATTYTLQAQTLNEGDYSASGVVYQRNMIVEHVKR